MGTDAERTVHHGRDPLTDCDALLAALECARAPTPDADAPRLLAIALVRQKIRPVLEGDRGPPHLAVLGATNTGKSTVVNLLTGSDRAGMSATARFSQHPVAFVPANAGDAWLTRHPSRFAGYERVAGAMPPRQRDESLRRDGYRRAIGVVPVERSAVGSAVVWDAPDFSTEAAQYYLEAVLETAAIADAVALVVTAESYADERALRLARTLRATGRRLVVVANRLPADADLLDDVRRTVAAQAQGGPVPVLPLPEAPGAHPAARLAALRARPEASALIEQLARALADVSPRDVAGASACFVRDRFDEVAQAALVRAEAVERWRHACDAAGARIVQAYRRSCLDPITSEAFAQALVRLSRLLEPPIVGPALRGVGAAVRAPAALLRRMRARSPGDAPVDRVLAGIVQEALADLASQAQRRAQEEGGLWQTLARRIGKDGRPESAVADLASQHADLRNQWEPEIEARAHALLEELRHRPKVLAALRSVNAALGVGSAAAVVVFHGVNWTDALLAPLAAGLQQELLRHGLGVVVQRQEWRLRRWIEDQFAGEVERAFVAPLRDIHGERATPEAVEAARRAAQRIALAFEQGSAP